MAIPDKARHLFEERWEGGGKASLPRSYRLRENQLSYLLKRPVVAFNETDRRQMGRHFEGVTVLVTGAAGSIGVEVCRRLLQVGAKKLVLLDSNQPWIGEVDLGQYAADLRRITEAERRSDIEVVVEPTELSDDQELLRVVRDHPPEYVLNLAGIKYTFKSFLLGAPKELDYQAALVRSNVLGLQALLNALQELNAGTPVTRSVLSATSDKTTQQPNNCYSASKRWAEEDLCAAARSGRYPFRVVAGRSVNVVDSSGNMFQKVTAAMLASMTEPRAFPLLGSDMERYFVTVGETARAWIWALVEGENGYAYWAEPGHAVRLIHFVRDYADMVYKHLPEMQFELQSYERTLPGENRAERPYMQGIEHPDAFRHGVVGTQMRHSVDFDVVSHRLHRLKEALAQKTEPVGKAVIDVLNDELQGAIDSERELNPRLEAFAGERPATVKAYGGTSPCGTPKEQIYQLLHRLDSIADPQSIVAELWEDVVRDDRYRRDPGHRSALIEEQTHVRTAILLLDAYQAASLLQRKKIEQIIDAFPVVLRSTGSDATRFLDRINLQQFPLPDAVRAEFIVRDIQEYLKLHAQHDSRAQYRQRMAVDALAARIMEVYIRWHSLRVYNELVPRPSGPPQAETISLTRKLKQLTVVLTAGVGFVAWEVVQQLQSMVKDPKGSLLAAWLRERNLPLDTTVKIYLVDDFSRREKWRVEAAEQMPNVELVPLDITDYGQLEAFRMQHEHELQDVVVLHCAQRGMISRKDPRAAYDMNVIGSLNVMRLTAGPRKIVLASTAATVGQVPIDENGEFRRVDEQTPNMPTTQYGLTKAAMEWCATFLAIEDTTFQYSTVGFGNVIGEDQTLGSAGIEPIVARLVIEYAIALQKWKDQGNPGKKPQLQFGIASAGFPFDFPDSERNRQGIVRDYSSVHQVAASMLRMVLKIHNGESCKIGSGVPMSILEFYGRMVRALYAVGATRGCTFEELAPVLEPVRNVPPYHVYDISKMRRVLGIHPPTSDEFDAVFRQIAEYWKWFSDHNWSPNTEDYVCYLRERVLNARLRQIADTAPERSAGHGASDAARQQHVPAAPDA